MTERASLFSRLSFFSRSRLSGRSRQSGASNTTSGSPNQAYSSASESIPFGSPRQAVTAPEEEPFHAREFALVMLSDRPNPRDVTAPLLSNLPPLVDELLSAIPAEAYGVKWELLRIALETPQDLSAISSISRLDVARISLNEQPHMAAAQIFATALAASHVREGVWTELDKEARQGLQRGGRVRFIASANLDQRTQQITIQLRPPRIGRESVEVRRRFGSLAFFELQTPPFPSSTMRDRLFDFVGHARNHLGQVWRALLVDGDRIHFVRTNEGRTGLTAPSREPRPPELDSLETLLDWHAPFTQNSAQTMVKRISRLHLLFSTTTPVEPAESINIVRGEDRFGVPDIATSVNGSEIMTDGNGLMGLSVTREVRRALGLPHVPSVVQARVCGSKGTW